MKTYIALGIGDMMAIDALLTQEERNNISEIYWACRFGKDIAPLLINNTFYPNLKDQYIIDDSIGMDAMRMCDSNCINFWHFRPDFHRNYNIGLQLFGLENERESLNVIDGAGILNGTRTFTNSSFLDNAKLSDVLWDEIGVAPNEYILVHYPTSTRPRTDIAQIDDKDWKFIEELSNDTLLKIVIVTDTEINIEIPNSIILIKPNILSVIALTKFAKYYAGCDSFISILSSKILPTDNVFIKSHLSDIQNIVLNSVVFQNYFKPNSPETISKFYKNYIGK